MPAKDIPITVEELRLVVERRIRDPEYLLYLLHWAAEQLTSASHRTCGCTDLDEACQRLLDQSGVVVDDTLYLQTGRSG